MRLVAHSKMNIIFYGDIVLRIAPAVSGDATGVGGGSWIIHCLKFEILYT